MILGQWGVIVDVGGLVFVFSVMVYDVQLSLFVIIQFEEKDLKLFWVEVFDKIVVIIGQIGDEVCIMVVDVFVVDVKSQYVLLKWLFSMDQYIVFKELKFVYLYFDFCEICVYFNGVVVGNIFGFLDSFGLVQVGIEQMGQECFVLIDGEELYCIGVNGVVIFGSEWIVLVVNGGFVQFMINSDFNWYLQQMIVEEVQVQGVKVGIVIVVEVKMGKICVVVEWFVFDFNDFDVLMLEIRVSQIFYCDFEFGLMFKVIIVVVVIEGVGLILLSIVSVVLCEIFLNGVVINDVFIYFVYNYIFVGGFIDLFNVVLLKFGMMVSFDVCYDYLECFGVGQKVLDFLFEVSGILYLVKDWDVQLLYMMIFGQYYIVIVVQFVGVYQVIVNGGEKIDFFFVELCMVVDGIVVDLVVLKYEWIIKEQIVVEFICMFENVVVQGGNVDWIQVFGYCVISKIGIVQVVDEVNGGYKVGVYYISMVGFVLVDDLQYVVVVIFDELIKVVLFVVIVFVFQKVMMQVMKMYCVMLFIVLMDEFFFKFGQMV